MALYLVQHAKSLPEDIDPERSLSAEGIAEVERTARDARDHGIAISVIYHSGKKRAEETAMIIGEYLAPPSGVRATQGLAPLDPVIPIAEVMQLETHSVMLVSHLPFLERLTGLLLAGDPDRRVVHFHTGACVCLLKEEDRWSQVWTVTPDLL